MRMAREYLTDPTERMAGNVGHLSTGPLLVLLPWTNESNQTSERHKSSRDMDSFISTSYTTFHHTPHATPRPIDNLSFFCGPNSSKLASIVFRSFLARLSRPGCLIRFIAGWAFAIWCLGKWRWFFSRRAPTPWTTCALTLQLLRLCWCYNLLERTKWMCTENLE